MIAPKAEVNSGLIEYVRWGAIGTAGADAQFADDFTMARTLSIRWRSEKR